MAHYLLIQGDCRQVLPYLKTESIQQIVTSPPYQGIMRYSDSQIEGEVGVRGTLEQYIDALTEVFQECYRLLKPTGLFMLNIDNSKRQEGFLELSAWDWIPHLKQVGFKLLATIIWVDYERRTIDHNHNLSHHYEPIFILAKTQHYTFNKNSIPYEGDVWEIKNPRRKDLEEGEGDMWDRSGVATFPVALIEPLIQLGSNPDDTVLDPFAGSGTVMDVAQRLDRSSIAIEIRLQFCEKIMERCFRNLPNTTYKFLIERELQQQAKP